MASVFEQVATRSGSMCEAMVYVPGAGVWTRCGRSPIQMHHMLLRSRGGTRLDDAGETHHLAALCMRCHQVAHEDRSSDLVIDGYVEDLGEGRLKYDGTDEYLLEKYGDRDGNAR